MAYTFVFADFSVRCVSYVGVCLLERKRKDFVFIKKQRKKGVKEKMSAVVIQEAPIFHPTEEEWQNPIKYIQSIRPEAEKAGTLKNNFFVEFFTFFSFFFKFKNFHFQFIY